MASNMLCNIYKLENLKYISSSSESTGETSATPSTRARSPSLDFKTQCMFCGCKKCKGDTNLIRIEKEETLKTVSKRCKEKSDNEFLRKIGSDISILPAFDTKYHTNCLKDYLRVKSKLKANESKEKSIHDKCFEQLVEYLDEKLLEGRALDTLDLLNRYKDLLKIANYEQYDAYTAQKLSLKLLNHYGEKMKITEEVNRSNFIFNSDIRIGDMINIAQTDKQLINDKKLIADEPRKYEDNILERAADYIAEGA